MKANVMPDGRISVPVELRKRNGFARGRDVVVEELDDAIVLRRRAQVVARARALSRQLLDGKEDASVDDFLAERRRDAGSE